MVNVLFPLVTTGTALICTQVTKLSDDNWKFPLQVVLAVFVVSEVTFIASSKVTAIVVPTATPVAVSAGVVETTVGIVKSAVTNPKRLVLSSSIAFPLTSSTLFFILI